MKKTIAFFLVIILILGGLWYTGLLNFPEGKNASAETAGSAQNAPDEPEFKKEGELTFTRNGEKLAIEIADNEAETTQGLMYRRSMPDSVGMLFIMPEIRPQSFWMKNTYISLDIIFLDENLKIVTIQANRIPFSEEEVPSYEPAKYVLEVNAGYCQRKGIQKGDQISYKVL